MPLDIRITVNDDRKRKLNEIDGAVDADKTTIKQRLMDEAIDEFHEKLFKADGPIKTMGTSKHE